MQLQAEVPQQSLIHLHELPCNLSFILVVLGCMLWSFSCRYLNAILL
jgi:hypothetical protein